MELGWNIFKAAATLWEREAWQIMVGNKNNIIWCL